MKKIKYSPDAADKLRELKKVVSVQYGADKAKQVTKTITDAIKGLALYEKKGPAVSDLFDVVTDYRYLFVKLFGVDTTPQETIEYWDE